MLKKIVYERLFGEFDYDINLKEGGISIITGPNGFGKSTILESIDAFYSFDILFFSRLDFQKISYFSTECETPISIEKKDGKLSIDELKISVEALYEEYFKKIRRPYYYRIDEDKWFDRRIEEIVSKNKIINEFLMNSMEEDFELEGQNVYRIKEKIKKYSGETKFIREQRLIKEEYDERDRKNTVNVIERLPAQFKERMNQVSSRYSSEANKLDSSYPNRLFKTTEGITEKEYSHNLKDMNEKFEKLNKYNISDIKRLEEQVEFLEEHSKALKIYFEDFEKNIMYLKTLWKN